MISRDAPRCIRCGVALPLHVAGCPESTPETATVKVEPLPELPGKRGYEVTQRSRFDLPWGDDE